MYVLQYKSLRHVLRGVYEEGGGGVCVQKRLYGQLAAVKNSKSIMRKPIVIGAKSDSFNELFLKSFIL